MAAPADTPPVLGFIGFGEAAEAFATGFGPIVAGRAAAYDMKLDDPALATQPRDRAARAGVALAPDRGVALTRAEAVFCLVTADRATAAAEECAAW